MNKPPFWRRLRSFYCWLTTPLGKPVPRSHPRSLVRKLHLELLESKVLPSVNPASQPYFERNLGQAGTDDPQVQYLSHGNEYSLQLATNHMSLDLVRPGTNLTDWADVDTPEDIPDALVDRLQLHYVNANPAATMAGQQQLPGIVNYQIGAQSIGNVATYGAVSYAELYAGVDALVRPTASRNIEIDYIVQPGGSADQIQFTIDSAGGFDLDGQGNLLIHLAGGDVTLRAPVLYQDDAAGVRHFVDGGFKVLDGGAVGFWTGATVANLPLTIDPEVLYTVYLGGRRGI